MTPAGMESGICGHFMMMGLRSDQYKMKSVKLMRFRRHGPLFPAWQRMSELTRHYSLQKNVLFLNQMVSSDCSAHLSTKRKKIRGTSKATFPAFGKMEVSTHMEHFGSSRPWQNLVWEKKQ